MREFLDFVLPDASYGDYVATILRSTGAQQLYTNTIESLVEILSQKSEVKANYYFLTGTITAGVKGRSLSDVAAKRALYVDLDFKDLKEIGDQSPVDYILKTVNDICDRAGIPRPNAYTESGGGVQPYWVYETPVEPAIWFQYSVGLKQLFINEYGQHDSGVTADAARIMRAPDTLNCKYTPPRPTYGHIIGERYHLSQFDSLLGVHVDKAVHSWTPKDSITQAMKDAGVQDIRNLPVYSISGIVESGQCPVFTWMDTPAAQRECPEPLWNDILAICAHAVDGAEWGHRLSKHDPRYTYEETQARLQRLNATQHPRRCSGMTENSACKGCQHRKTEQSPIRFGIYKPVVPDAAAPAPMSKPIAETAAPTVFDLQDEMIKLLRDSTLGLSDDDIERISAPDDMPVGYAINFTRFGIDKIITKVIEKDDVGDDLDKELGTGARVAHETIKITDGLMWIGGVLRSSDGLYSLSVWVWPRRDEPPREVLISDDALTSPTKFASVMAAHGLMYMLRVPKLAQALCADWAAYAKGAYQTSFAFQQVGWVRNGTAFNTGTECIFRVGTDVRVEPVRMDHVFRQYGTRFGPKGTLDNWQCAANTLLGPRREWHRLVLMTSFASPLMRLTSNATAHVVHLYSTASGSGKSSTQKLAASVWGDPLKNLGSSGSTFRSLMEKCSHYGSLTYPIDEITTFDSQQYREMAYFIAGGQARQRLTDQGEIQTMKEPWCFVGLTSANCDVNYEMSRVRNAEGEAARITSIMFPTGAVDMDRQFDLELCHTNFGVAGHAFIREVFRLGVANVQRRVRAKAQALVQQFGMDDITRAEQRFRCDLFAASLVAAEVCMDVGILAFPIDSLENCIAQILTAHVQARGDRFAQVLASISGWVASHARDTLRLVRANGRLHTVRSASNFVEDAQTAFNVSRSGDVILILNDTPPGVDPATGWTRPALLIAESRFAAISDTMFPSIRTNPMTELPAIFAAYPDKGCTVDSVKETIGGLTGSYVRILLPAELVSAEDVKRAVAAAQQSMALTAGSRP